MVVNLASVRTVVDEEGRYGRKGGSHAITTATVFRDTWTKTADQWKLTSREQVGPSKVSADHAPAYSEYLKEYHVVGNSAP